jgi:hypothetical protein
LRAHGLDNDESDTDRRGIYLAPDGNTVMASLSAAGGDILLAPASEFA